jgi:outer membrane protein TolC
MTRSILARRIGWAVVALAGWAFGAGVARAQVPGTVSLDQAVRSTVDKSPDVLAAREDIALGTGRLREAKGVFNLKLHLGSTIEHTDQYLSAKSWFFEWRRRFQLEETNKALTQVRLGLAQSLANGSSARPFCPDGFSFVRRSTDPTNADRPICIPVTSDSLAVDYGAYQNFFQEASSFFLPPPSTGFDPLAALEFTRRLAQINGLSIPDFVEDRRQMGFEELQNVYRLVTEYEQLTALWRSRLGDIPPYEIDNTLRVTADVIKPFKSGGALGFSFAADGTESKYRNRSMDPDFGGKSVNNLFHGKLEVLFNQPLLRGRGASAARAPELSAERNLEASRLTYLHTVSRGVLDTTLSYLDLVAAQQSLAMLEEELSAERRLLDATMRLSAAGALARTDATRMQARVADVQASVVEARQRLVVARADLAQTAGLAAADVAGEVGPADRFPETPAAVEVDALLRGGTATRNDIRAAEASRESARILLGASQNDARRRLDLQIHAGYANGYYGSFFRVLKDEYPYTKYHCTSDWTDTSQPCFEPGDSPLNFYNPAGVWRAWRDRPWEPEAGIKFTFELPFGNNRALGRLAQAQAAVHQADVQVTDLTRVAQENALQQAAALGKARDEWLRWKDAVTEYSTTWADTEKRRAAGDMTLIDTLKTEQDLTNARLQLVQVQHDYAAALAQLRFETGTLVTLRDNRPEPDLAGLVVPRQ